MKRIEKIINECVNRCLKKYLKETVNHKQEINGVIVYRGMNKNHGVNQNVWVTDSFEYAQYWTQQEYNDNGIVNEFFLPNSVIRDLCNATSFEELMDKYGAWQPILDDSPIWENGEEDAEYDLMHDLCFPSKEQISILKKEGYKGLLFRYDDSCFSILIFNGRDLKPI